MADALRDEVGAILAGELADPRIGLANVSEVLLANDGKSAQVLINVEGSDEDADATMDGLEAAKGFIRREIGESLGLRRVPELHFRLDRSKLHEGRVQQLLKRVKKGKR